MAAALVNTYARVTEAILAELRRNRRSQERPGGQRKNRSLLPR